MSSLTYNELLRGNHAFRRLLFGQVASELGNWFNFIAALGLVRAISGASAEATAGLLIARLLPFALFAPVAGTFVDRLSRRTVMILSDAGRGIAALGFLFVSDANDLWIAYLFTIIGTMLAAFFEGARNAALANVVGSDGMLAGNALMFSSRFLLMSIGAAAGGVATETLGYRAAFVLNALAFVLSALCIWRVPEEAMRSETERRAGLMTGENSSDEHGARGEATNSEVAGGVSRVWRDLREGWSYIFAHRLVAAVLGVNIMWAIGGGAVNLIYDRLGGVYFAAREGWSGDAGVSIFYVAAGAGMFVGMLLARRLGAYVELRGRVPQFIGWALILHGVIFALTGFMPSLWLAALMVFLSRIVVAAEFAVQETLVMRLLPNELRGRVFTTDRAAEIGVMSLSTGIAGASLTVISASTLAVLSGLFAGLPGAIWLWLFARGKLCMPVSLKTVDTNEEDIEGDRKKGQVVASTA